MAAFKDKVNQIADEAAARYLVGDVNPNETIAKHAAMEKLSALQIERVVNKANRKIIVSLQKTAARKDPHFTFPTAKTASVIGMIKTQPNPKLPKKQKETREMLNDSLPKVAGKRKEAGMKYASIKRQVDFHEVKFDRAMLDLEKTARQVLVDQPLEVVMAVKDRFSASGGVQAAIDSAHEKMARYNLKSIDEEFEIVDDHPFVKKARLVVELETEGIELKRKLREEYNAYRNGN